MSTPPDNWQQLRDRWGTFHIIRVVAGIEGLIVLIMGACFGLYALWMDDLSGNRKRVPTSGQPPNENK